MAWNGFITMLVSNVENTSVSPPGADSFTPSWKLSATGNRKLPITATAAAASVATMYRMMTLRNRAVRGSPGCFSSYGRRHKKGHEHRGDGLQCAYKNMPEYAYSGPSGHSQSQNGAYYQADKNL